MSTNRDDEWFKAFVRTLPNGEVIEDVIRTEEIPTDFRNADYFFNRRRIIGELKTLEASRISRIQAVIDRLRDRGELPIYFHPAPVNKVIKDHPQKAKLNIQFVGQIGRTLAHAFRDANQQIAQTKNRFTLTSARGTLIVRNTILPELTPRIAWNEIVRLIMKKKGSYFLYPHIECVIYLQDVEIIQVQGRGRLTPSVTITRNKDPELSSFSKAFLAAYAKAVGVPFVEIEGDPVQILEKTSVHERFRPEPTHKRGTRADRWNREYLSKRIYRQLNDDQLVEELARFTLEESLVLKDGKIALDIATGEKQEHLFTECEIRHIDMRLVGKKLNALLQNKSLKGEVAQLLMERQERAAASRTKNEAR